MVGKSPTQSSTLAPPQNTPTSVPPPPRAPVPQNSHQTLALAPPTRRAAQKNSAPSRARPCASAGAPAFPPHPLPTGSNGAPARPRADAALLWGQRGEMGWGASGGWGGGGGGARGGGGQGGRDPGTCVPPPPPPPSTLLSPPPSDPRNGSES